MDVSEVELVQGCLAGDGVSQRRLVEQFQGMVFGLCLRMLGHRQDAWNGVPDSLARPLSPLGRELRQAVDSLLDRVFDKQESST